jgi:hypothetical protein
MLTIKHLLFSTMKHMALTLATKHVDAAKKKGVIQK